ncbi:ABC transporter permease [Niallia nealsonii]|uniref:ABC transporter permease n=1 Tax=Niallia nealsonii TaxID=115979 RepID=A0A2N0YZ88_9BACI|nr:ABC transporter permease [Niallia nealsonii]PKG22554.1 ABC transporter permease [Niallia nealsonii]
MRIKGLIIRILKQFYRDKRTVAMMIVAPIFVLTLLNLIFDSNAYTPKVGVVQVSEQITTKLKENDVKIYAYSTVSQAKKAIVDKKIDGYLSFENKTPAIFLEGSDPTVTKATITMIQDSIKAEDTLKPTVQFLYGSEDMNQFDAIGPVLLGFFAFFFVFLVGGVAFLRERTSGTLERLLSSPIRRWEIVIGYVIGFGIFTMVQSIIIVFYSVYILDLIQIGSIVYVILITLLLSLTALTLGMLLSSYAKNELQMFQFIPIIVVPQVFFSGLFNLDGISSTISWISTITPLYYAADALKNVMIRGLGIEEIFIPLVVLSIFSLVFLLCNVLSLKNYRKI